MARQKGQSMVEFVLAVPILMLLVFGMIYGALIYADYLQYNNAIRDVARDIAIQAGENRDQLASDLNNQVPSVVSRYVHPISNLNLYKGTFSVQPLDKNRTRVASFTSEEAVEVEVRVDFEKQSAGGVVPAFARGVLPKQLNSIKYTMRLEEDKKDSEEDQADPVDPANPAESPEGEG